MKKIISLFLVSVLALSFAACGKNSDQDKENSTEKNEMSGINSEVSKTETAKGSEFTFDGYMTTIVPEGISAEDISINSDSTLFNFSDTFTIFDVSFAERYETEEEVIAAVNEIAFTGSATPADAITINDISFYGANLPDYGMIRYIGFVNGYDVTVSLYTDLDNEAFQSFVKNTVFTVQ